ncbi:MAG TPA: alpha/beta hydrolase-fold protein [Oculatellaceae cyanobacterium]
MRREYEKWHSKTLGRDMELLAFGHAGARVIVFPTSCGRFYDWENRGMLEPIREHIENGWIQVFFVDSVDVDSWWNNTAHPTDKAKKHLDYQKYIVDEVLPYTKSKNSNDFVIALGASMGGYHAVNIALRYPDYFNRTIGMSGPYDMRQMAQPYPIFNWVNDYYDENILQSDPVAFVRHLNDERHIQKIKNMDIIFSMGEGDPLYPGNETFTQALSEKDISHAYRVWDGFAHDWPYWKEMILHYIGGADSKQMPV